MPPRARKEGTTPPPKDETLPLLQYGAELFRCYEATTPPPPVTDLQMARFGDYVHHFGFSLEREHAVARRSAGVLPAIQAGNTGALSTHKHAQASMVAGNDAVEDAAWGMPAEEQSMADAQCGTVGSLRDADGDVAALAHRVCEPFQEVTWRQSRFQCALKKTRCLYTWLCQNVRVVLESEIESAAASRALALAAEDKKKPRGKAAGTSSPPQQRKGGAKKGTSAARDAETAETAAQPDDAQPVDPLEDALRSRVATPHVLADLYARMLHSVGVACEVVSGWVKGSTCEEAHDWYWNIVQIDGKHYLIDVAASTFTGTLRPPKRDEGTVEGEGGAPAVEAVKRSASPAAAETSKKKRGGGDAGGGGSGTPGEMDAPGGGSEQMHLSAEQEVALHRQVFFVNQRRVVEDFYFCCHPMHFIYTHLPRQDRLTLLVQPPHRAVWLSAPRLTHDFFRFPVELFSHKRSAAFTARSTPFYVTVTNTAPATTELACKVYRGTLADLPERLCETPNRTSVATNAKAANSSKRREDTAPADSAALPGTALSLDWTWQQRCESLQTETFTIMTPDVGYYSVVIGARPIRGDPYGATIASTLFTPIVRYQVRVNFVPVSAPLLPRQHLSPSVCRLISPLCGQVQAGQCTVSVMPSCSNVCAVAAVVRTAYTSPAPPVLAPVAAHKGGVVPSSGGLQGDGASSAGESAQRELLAFLPFNTSAAVYSGGVSVPSGGSLEVWVLYTAPDENGLTFRDRVHHRVAAAAAAAATNTNPSNGGEQQPAAVSGAADVSRGKVRSAKAKARKQGAAGDASTEEDASARQRARFAALLEQGRAFRPFVTGIDARKLTTSDVKELIQPQPTLETEREPTLRRLIGVTDALYQEATTMRQQEAQPVGTYLDARAPGTTKGKTKHP